MIEFTCEPSLKLRVKAEFTPYVPGKRSGHPDTWTPDEGGELEEFKIFLGTLDITDHLDLEFNEVFHDLLEEAGRRQRQEEQEDSFYGE